MKPFTILLLLSLLFLQTSCGKKAHDHAGESAEEHAAHSGHDHDAHAGHDDHAPGLLEVGDHLAHIDFVHDAASGTVTLHVTGPDAKTALALSDAPKLNLIGDNPTQIVTRAFSPDADGASAEFSASDPALKAEPEGRIAVTVGGQTYQVIIEHDHGSHEGHDH